MARPETPDRPARNAQLRSGLGRIRTGTLRARPRPPCCGCAVMRQKPPAKNDSRLAKMPHSGTATSYRARASVHHVPQERAAGQAPACHVSPQFTEKMATLPIMVTIRQKYSTMRGQPPHTAGARPDGILAGRRAAKAGRLHMQCRRIAAGQSPMRVCGRTRGRTPHPTYML